MEDLFASGEEELVGPRELGLEPPALEDFVLQAPQKSLPETFVESSLNFNELKIKKPPEKSDGFFMVGAVYFNPNRILLHNIVVILDIYHKILSISRDVLHQKYVVEGLSIGQIAEQLMSSKFYVWNLISKYGIPSRPAKITPERHAHPPYGARCEKEQANVRLILRYREEGLSIRRIIARLEEENVSPRHNKWHRELIRSIINRARLGR